MADDLKVDGMGTRQTPAQQQQVANLLMGLVIMKQLLRIPELEEQARMDNADPILGLVLQLNVAHLRDFVGSQKVLLLIPFLYIVDDMQITVSHPIINSTTVQLVTQTRFPLEPIHLQSLEQSLDQSSTDLVGFMIVLTLVIWR
jgi:hypothetical protein